MYDVRNTYDRKVDFISKCTRKSPDETEYEV